MLRDVIHERPAHWGTPNVLVKLLDPVERLPVHAHPDREFARVAPRLRLREDRGMEIVATRDGSSEVWLGLREDVEPEQLPRVDRGAGRRRAARLAAPARRAAGRRRLRAGRRPARDRRRRADRRAPGADRLLDPLRVEGLSRSIRTTAHLGLGWDDCARCAAASTRYEPALGLPPEAAEFFSVDDRAEPAGRFGVLLVLEGEGELDGRAGARRRRVRRCPRRAQPFEVRGDLQVIRCLGGNSS